MLIYNQVSIVYIPCYILTTISVRKNSYFVYQGIGFGVGDGCGFRKGKARNY
jgi:hypothetical protein